MGSGLTSNYCKPLYPSLMFVSKVRPPRGLFYKTLQIRNLQENYKFRSELVSSGLDKHINLDMGINLDKQTR